MIRNFRHRGLKRFFEKDDFTKLPPEDANKIARILARLNEAADVQNMDLTGFRLHPLKGNYKGFWSVTVRANWRVIFRFEEGYALDVDYIDYH
ncbi:MAG: type II toxin-antitoxin system RelE/ParE family toxin [Alphaproteobacteria bacterium]